MGIRDKASKLFRAIPANANVAAHTNTNVPSYRRATPVAAPPTSTAAILFGPGNNYPAAAESDKIVDSIVGGNLEVSQDSYTPGEVLSDT